MFQKTPCSIRKPLFWTSFLVLLTLVLAACAPAAAPVPTSTSAPAATTAPTTAAAAPVTEVTVSVATDSKLGKILVDQSGMTLYAFSKDTPDTSTCTGACGKNWPALVSQGSPKAGPGVDASRLATVTLSNGAKIVTYNHMPLYHFSKDQKPGDVNGQNIAQVWFAVSPDGKMVAASGSVPATGGAQAMINVATDPKLGKILVDGKGMTLYIFTQDTKDTATCTGGCAKYWPPFVATGEVKAGAGVDQSMIGAAALADGSKIVTYNHMPLYYFAADTKPGDTSGQGFQNVWYVVGPDGKAIMTAGK